jgi:peptidyl-tRNA hydrolase
MKQLIIVRKDLIDEYGYPKMMVQVAHAGSQILGHKAIEENNVDGFGCLQGNGIRYVIELTENEFNWT